MSGEFKGLVALVTGGASGIGAAIVAELISEGAEVAVLDLHIDHVAPPALGLSCDITNSESVDAAVQDAVDTFGRLDVVVNNAGVGAQGTVAENEDAEWARVLDVNVIGLARVSRAALPYLRKSPAAAIVNTCSVVATVGLPRRALYSATKGAVLALTQAMAADHLREGIRVNCVSPGTVETPWVERLLADTDDPATERTALNARQPHGRMVAAEEVAAAVAYLANPRAGSTTGAALAVDGGLQAIRLPGR